MSLIWLTRSFTAAPPGWKIATLWKSDAEPRISAMPGWLVQEHVEYDHDRDQVTAELDTAGNVVQGEMRVVAGIVNDGQVEPGDLENTAFVVLEPGEDELTTEMVEELQRSVQMYEKQLNEARQRAREGRQA